MKKKEYKNIYLQEEKHWWYLGMQRITETFLKKIPKKHMNLNILDAGCGTGGMIQYLQQYGKVTGIDYSSEALRFCQKRGLKDIYQASIESPPFKDQVFDLVTCFDVLYHEGVNDDTRAIKEFHRILKTSGYLLVRVPAYNWLRGKHDLEVQTKHRYTKTEIVNKLQINGFTVIKYSYANTILFPLVIAKRIIGNLSSKKVETDVKNTSKILNLIFLKILLLEAKIIDKAGFPFGLSIFILAKKTN